MITPVTDPGVLEGYLVDASNLRGHADALWRPRTVEEVQEIVADAQRRGTPLTISARRTSTTGAPVPFGGAVLSTEGLATVRADDDVDGGVLLGAWQDELERRGRFFPPDPTSRHECSIGGAIACNASGARTFKYGPTRPWVESVDAVLPDGRLVHADRSTPLPWTVPLWTPPAVKTAAGYYPATNLLDLLIGSEGSLGLVVRAQLRLIPAPPAVLTFLAFFPTRTTMLDFLVEARRRGPRCIESFDRRSLRLIAGRVPDVPEADTALLLEIEHDGEPPLEPWFELLVESRALVDETIVVTDDAGRARLQAVRHALPAAVNERIVRSGVRKVGTDCAVPAHALATMLEVYDSVPMDAVCFGHIGDSHLHLNLLPRDQAELARAKELYFDICRRAVELGGTVSAEHGIGRLKKEHLALMVPPEVLAGWRALRRQADPNLVFGRGVMIDV